MKKRLLIILSTHLIAFLALPLFVDAENYHEIVTGLFWLVIPAIIMQTVVQGLSTHARELVWLPLALVSNIIVTLTILGVTRGLPYQPMLGVIVFALPTGLLIAVGSFESEIKWKRSWSAVLEIWNEIITNKKFSKSYIHRELDRIETLRKNTNNTSTIDVLSNALENQI